MKSLRRLERNKESFRVGAVIGQLEKRVRAFRDFIDLLCQATNWEQFVTIQINNSNIFRIDENLECREHHQTLRDL